MKKALLPLAVAASLSLSAGSASAEFLDFTMNYGSVPEFPVADFLIIADKLNGGYDEIINLTPTGNPANFIYDTQAFINFGSVFSGEGTTLEPGFGSASEAIFPAGFGMYAIFTSTGTYNSGVFGGGTGGFELFIDVDQNTTKTFDALGNIVVANNSDDYKIGFATVMDYLIGLPFGVPSAYDTTFSDFTLTTGDENAALAGDQNGDLFFVAPRPFHLVLQSNGDFDQFIPNYGGNPLQIRATGDVSAVFKVPEPSSLALLGLGLTGLGLAMRRRKAA